MNTTAADFLRQIHAGESRMVYADWLQEEHEDQAIIQRIIAEPHSDTHRLNYAAWLEGQAQADQVKCEKCLGAKTLRYWDEDGDREGIPCFRFTKCDRCEGIGTVPNPELMERAELIRVQVELWQIITTRNGIEYSLKTNRVTALRARESALLAKYPQWRPKCVVCDGSGEINGGHVGLTGCRWCQSPGTHPLMNGTGHIGELHRGFLRSVKVPRTADVLTTLPGPGFKAERQLTAYARDLLRDHPTVERVECANAYLIHNGTSGWCSNGKFVPEIVIERAKSNGLEWSMTEPQRRDALAVAVAETLREMIEKENT